MGANNMCMHCGGRQTCEYIKDEYLDEDGNSFALKRDLLANQVFNEPPVRNLMEERP
jgi:hypothetical protein